MSILFKSIVRFNPINYAKSFSYFKAGNFEIRNHLNKRILTRNEPKSKRWYSQTESATEENIVEILNKKVAQNKLQNILVFSCSSIGSIRVNFLGLIGGLILLGASYNSWYLFSSIRFKSRKIDEDGGFFSTILKLIGSDYFKIALCSTTAIIGILTVFVTMFFTVRSVNKMYLLKGGNKIGIVTDGIFGKEMKYVLNLGETSFTKTRKMRTPQVTFKNRKHFFYFLMNNVDGVYHEKDIFDHIICAKRSI